jgi:hypothetical protein
VTLSTLLPRFNMTIEIEIVNDDMMMVMVFMEVA